MKRLACIIWVFLAVLSSLPALGIADDRALEDVVIITGVSPDSVTSGEEIEVSIKVAYALRTHDSGAIRLTANTLAPNGDRSIASAAVKKGNGEITLTAKIIPRYWSDVVPFGVNAALLVPVGDALQTRARSVDRINFHIRPSPTTDAVGSWPSVQNTYVDGIAILSITPETFEEGREQDIVVRVRHELLSREDGEIGLSVNDGRPASRLRVGSKQIKIGKGETEVHARFSPKKTAGLPFGRILLTLNEFPRGKATEPLAWDEATIEIK